MYSLNLKKNSWSTSLCRLFLQNLPRLDSTYLSIFYNRFSYQRWFSFISFQSLVTTQECYPIIDNYYYDFFGSSCHLCGKIHLSLLVESFLTTEGGWRGGLYSRGFRSDPSDGADCRRFPPWCAHGGCTRWFSLGGSPWPRCLVFLPNDLNLMRFDLLSWRFFAQIVVSLPQYKLLSSDQFALMIQEHCVNI